ncbi:MAG: exodeoxyribonuclease VII large subunit [Bacteroidetes bacterium]|nr:exodeoxyribonuclease VII large subunit [Rhodothermaceae bacterium RA]RMH67170.1 MAG: exodeoxyribonuclease VII large subunit [Bacteroidota bacterium]
MNNRRSRPEGPSLFDPAEPAILSVRELVRDLKEAVERGFGHVRVEGELSNVRRPASGHCYFTLKDADAQLRCVMWRFRAGALFFEPRDGLLVRAHGEVSIYERRGDLQMIVERLEPAGEGALQQAFEALKEKLRREGLFNAAHKKPLPPYPEAIGIVTSGSGAALHDVLSILERRYPLVRVLVCPVQVQGLGAAAAIAEAIAAFNALPPGDPLRPDVLIVGRGGGSAEDLWAFNEEPVARAIFASEIPIVSAVGHETDVSIADFVADVRAATPSMAAELVVPDRRDLIAAVRGARDALRSAMQRRLMQHRQHIRHLVRSYAFNRPPDRLRQEQQRLDDLTDRLHRAMHQRLQDRRRALAHLEDRLHALDPERPLRQGYARIERHGQRVRNAADLRPDDAVTLHFHDGARRARIEPDASP